MLVEIIMAFAITFVLLYFMMDLVIKMKNKNDDLLVETIVRTDSTIITNGLMAYAKEIKTEEEANDFCKNIIIDGKTIKYANKVIDILDDTASISSSVSEGYACNAANGRLKVRIPVSVKQMKDENFDVIIDYRYNSSSNSGGDEPSNPSDTPVLPDDKPIVSILESYKCSNRRKGSEPYTLVYTGNCSEPVLDGDDGWKVKFLTTGTLTVAIDMDIDAFLVGGGGGGLMATAGYYLGGGGGGYTKLVEDISLATNNYYVIEIGLGGEGGGDDGSLGSATDGKPTSAFGYSVAGGKRAGGGGYNIGGSKGGDGGSGGGAGTADGIYAGPGAGGSYGGNGHSSGILGDGDDRVIGKGQGKTTCEFEEGTLYGCNPGVDAYSPGGGGAGQYEIYSKGSGLTGNNSGAGGSASGNKGESGKSGVVVIRNKR